MRIHEYQAKKIFAEHDIPILKGGVAYTPQEALRVAQKIGGKDFVIKAQIHSDLRQRALFLERNAGKGGGIRKITIDQIYKNASQMLGKHLKTHRTGSMGQEVKKVYIEEQVKKITTFYLSLDVDFLKEGAFLTLFDRQDIQNKIVYQLDNVHRISSNKALKLAQQLKLDKKNTQQMAQIICSADKIFRQYSALKVEINPITLTTDKKLVALNGHIIFDPDAVDKYASVEKMRDLEEETPNEIKARLNHFRYTKMSGNIGCITNGSGLSLCTLDMLFLTKGQPACILDIGAETTEEIVSNALKTILSEPDIEGVFINIFGGVTRCDVVAKGLINAAIDISVGMPIVVRMDGTNAEAGCKILTDSGLPFTVIRGMEDSAKEIVRQVGEIE